MTDSFAAARRPVDNAPANVAMSRLADRIASMAPPPLDLPPTSIIRPAVAAALSTSAKNSARAAERARRSRSVVGLMVDSFVSACSFIPYALVALALRLVMARLFFLDGQSKVTGPRVSLNIYDFDLSFVLPMQVKAESFGALMPSSAFSRGASASRGQR